MIEAIGFPFTEIRFWDFHKHDVLSPVHTTRVFTARGEKIALSCNAFFNTATSVKNVDREHGP